MIRYFLFHHVTPLYSIYTTLMHPSPAVKLQPPIYATRHHMESNFTNYIPPRDEKKEFSWMD